MSLEQIKIEKKVKSLKKKLSEINKPISFSL